MLASIYVKLIGIVLIFLLFVGIFLWGHHVGASNVQAKWNAEKVSQQAAVAEAQLHADAESTAMRNQYNALSANYEATLHAQVPALADSVSSGISTGALRLRYSSPCPSTGGMSKITAASRAADAAATQALADRVASSISAVRAGDAADARERQLDAQIIGLQGILKVERP